MPSKYLNVVKNKKEYKGKTIFNSSKKEGERVLVKKRCPPGTRRSKKTGKCVSKRSRKSRKSIWERMLGT